VYDAWTRRVQILLTDVGPDVVMVFSVVDYDLIGKDEVMGEYEVIMDKAHEAATFLRDSSEEYSYTWTLLPARKKGAPRKLGKPRGELKVRMHYTPFFNASAAPQDTEDPARAMEAAQVRANALKTPTPLFALQELHTTSQILPAHSACSACKSSLGPPLGCMHDIGARAAASTGKADQRHH
jgi:hypothetical protein